MRRATGHAWILARVTAPLGVGGLTLAALACWRTWWLFDVLVDTLGKWVGVAGALAGLAVVALVVAERRDGERALLPFVLSCAHPHDDPLLAAVPRRRAHLPALTTTARTGRSRTASFGSPGGRRGSARPDGG